MINISDTRYKYIGTDVNNVCVKTDKNIILIHSENRTEGTQFKLDLKNGDLLRICNDSTVMFCPDITPYLNKFIGKFYGVYGTVRDTIGDAYSDVIDSMADAGKPMILFHSYDENNRIDGSMPDLTSFDEKDKLNLNGFYTKREFDFQTFGLYDGSVETRTIILPQSQLWTHFGENPVHVNDYIYDIFDKRYMVVTKVKPHYSMGNIVAFICNVNDTVSMKKEGIQEFIEEEYNIDVPVPLIINDMTSDEEVWFDIEKELINDHPIQFFRIYIMDWESSFIKVKLEHKSFGDITVYKENGIFYYNDIDNVKNELSLPIDTFSIRVFNRDKLIKYF